MADETVSDFLKCAYKIGKIKDVSEAFEEFNPEEEIHKGRPEFWLKEKTECYNGYSVGDIVFVDSIVKTDVIYRIKTEQILFKIGHVDYEKIEAYRKYYLNQNKT